MTHEGPTQQNPILFHHGQSTEQKNMFLFLIREKYKHFSFPFQGNKLV